MKDAGAAGYIVKTDVAESLMVTLKLAAISR
jgi:hypothetical protein